MVCFPYTFLIREFWKVPKKQRNSLPVLYFHTVCVPPPFSLIPTSTLGCGATTTWSGVYGEAPAPATGTPHFRSPQRTPHCCPCQILAPRCCQRRDVRTWSSATCQVQFKLPPPSSPAAWRMGLWPQPWGKCFGLLEIREWGGSTC